MVLPVVAAAVVLVAVIVVFGAYALKLMSGAEESARIEDLEARVEELEAENDRLRRERMALADELGHEDVAPEEFELADEEA